VGHARKLSIPDPFLGSLFFFFFFFFRFSRFCLSPETSFFEVKVGLLYGVWSIGLFLVVSEQFSECIFNFRNYFCFFFARVCFLRVSSLHSVHSHAFRARSSLSRFFELFLFFFFFSFFSFVFFFFFVCLRVLSQTLMRFHFSFANQGRRVNFRTKQRFFFFSFFFSFVAHDGFAFVVFKKSFYRCFFCSRSALSHLPKHGLAQLFIKELLASLLTWPM
jgi:hypothetical protein